MSLEKGSALFTRFAKKIKFLCTKSNTSLTDKKSDIVFDESGYPNFINPFGNSKSPPDKSLTLGTNFETKI